MSGMGGGGRRDIGRRIEKSKQRKGGESGVRGLRVWS